MRNNKGIGHLSVIITIILWGSTFISTKVLLRDFQPVDILFIRFVMGFLALVVFCPKLLKTKGIKEEVTFVGAGLSGICLYYLLENIALTYTTASNVGVIVSASPLFTAVLSRIFIKTEGRLGLNFFVGFIAAMCGIVIISLDGFKPGVNITGDLLSVLAAFMWGCYSVLTKKIGDFGYSVILTTRRVFFYGIIFMLPFVFFCGFSPDMKLLFKGINLFNFLYLGLGASALCFVTWNFGVNVLGAVKSGVYIYLIPVITVIASVIILNEKITLITGVGMGLTLLGLIISEMKFVKKL